MVHCCFACCTFRNTVIVVFVDYGCKPLLLYVIFFRVQRLEPLLVRSEKYLGHKTAIPVWKQMQNSLICYNFFSFLALNRILSDGLPKNVCSSRFSCDTCRKRKLSSSIPKTNVYPNNMFAELFAFVSMFYLTNLSLKR